MLNANACNTHSIVFSAYQHTFECVSAYKRHRKTILVNTFAIMDSDIDQGQPMLPISDLVPRRGNLRAQEIHPYEVMQARHKRYQRQSAICLSGSRARCLYGLHPRPLSGSNVDVRSRHDIRILNGGLSRMFSTTARPNASSNGTTNIAMLSRTYTSVCLALSCSLVNVAHIRDARRTRLGMGKGETFGKICK
jgi:hypothetical protein